MTHPTRGLLIVVLGLVGLSITACGPTASSATPSSAPSVISTESPATPTATTAPTASAADISCDLKPQTGTLPSDRLTGMQILGLPGTDLVTFQFSPGSPSPAGAPIGSLDVATPPFTEGASGLPIALEGQRAIQVVFRGMSLQNDVGQETYTGEREIRVTDPSRRLRHVVIFDESEGQMGWYLGYDGPACVTLSSEGDDILVAITFGPGS